MKIEIKEEIEIPAGVEVKITGNEITLKGPKGETKQKLKTTAKTKDNKIIVELKKATKKDKTQTYTDIAHIKNLLRGVQKGFEYKLKACSSHFPMTLAVQGNKLTIKNFFGEKNIREVEIPTDVKAKIQGDEITLESTNRESAGKTASKIELKTRVQLRDRRVFQDGIYITKKPEREL